MDERTSSAGSGSYRTGAIEIDAVHRRVRVDGAPVKIGGRAFDVLVALAERRERVVPKRELMDAVWPRLVVEENNLLVHMVALRKVLGPHAIVTIPGRGYRFALPAGMVTMLAGDAPPLPVIAGNLPSAPGPLGRTDELAALEALLLEHDAVSIVGAAGIGKTRLALAAATATRVATPGGRWWVDLAAVIEGAQLVGAIATALGLPLSAGGTADESLASALSSRRLLVVLDNCEHLADEVGSLVERLRERAPDLRVLVTSQEPLKHRDEHVYRLGPLAVPANADVEAATRFGAVALFVERAHGADTRFRLSADNVESVVDVCRRLDGIPLAIELAAARVPMLGVHGLHARLGEMFNVLTGGARMKLRRHETLRAAFEWSHGLLSVDEQVAFRRIGVFAGGFTLELAQALVEDARIDRWLVLDLLGHLIDKSLVIADGETEPRYRLLETTRAFALEKLAAAAESEATLRRHARVMADYMADVDARCWDLTPALRRRAVEELANVRAAADWATGSGDAELAYELLARCWLVWLQNGAIAEGVHRMLALWPPAPGLPRRVEADFCQALARLNPPSVREEHWLAARRAETIYRQLGDTSRLADALLLAGTIGPRQGHLAEAAQALREAASLVDGATPLRKQAALATTQGEHALLAGENDRALEAFRRQAALYARAGARIGELLALGNVGTAQLQAGDIDAAITSLRAAIEGLRSLQAPMRESASLGALALALALRGHADALAVAREAFHALRSAGRISAPLLAAALHHVRHDAQRAVLAAGCALGPLTEPNGHLPLCHAVRQRVRSQAEALHAAALVEQWLAAGEAMSEERAAAVAFDGAPVDAVDAAIAR